MVFYMCVGISYGSADVSPETIFHVPGKKHLSEVICDGHMVASSAREQSKDNPCQALQTITTKKLATAVADILMLKQLIPANSPEELSASFSFPGPTSSVVLTSGTDALGTA